MYQNTHKSNVNRKKKKILSLKKTRINTRDSNIYFERDTESNGRVTHSLIMQSKI